MKLSATLVLALFALSAPFAAAHAQETSEAARSPPAWIGQNPIEQHIAGVMQRLMQRCWQMPIDQPEPERLVITLQFSLNEDGTLRGQPRVVSPRNYAFDRPMRVAAERAIEAVRDCAPYPFPTDPITAEHYELWDEFAFTFASR